MLNINNYINNQYTKTQTPSFKGKYGNYINPNAAKELELLSTELYTNLPKKPRKFTQIIQDSIHKTYPDLDIQIKDIKDAFFKPKAKNAHDIFSYTQFQKEKITTTLFIDIKNAKKILRKRKNKNDNAVNMATSISKEIINAKELRLIEDASSHLKKSLLDTKEDNINNKLIKKYIDKTLNFFKLDADIVVSEELPKGASGYCQPEYYSNGNIKNSLKIENSIKKQMTGTASHEFCHALQFNSKLFQKNKINGLYSDVRKCIEKVNKIYTDQAGPQITSPNEFLKMQNKKIKFFNETVKKACTQFKSVDKETILNTLIIHGKSEGQAYGFSYAGNSRYLICQDFIDHLTILKHNPEKLEKLLTQK